MPPGAQQNLLLLRRHVLHQLEQPGATGEVIAFAEYRQLLVAG